jgi:hypothetical protein
MKKLTHEAIKIKGQDFDKSIFEPENNGDPTVDEFYAKDRQALRK